MDMSEQRRLYHVRVSETGVEVVSTLVLRETPKRLTVEPSEITGYATTLERWRNGAWTSNAIPLYWDRALAIRETAKHLRSRADGLEAEAADKRAKATLLEALLAAGPDGAPT